MFGIPNVIALPGMYVIAGAVIGLAGWFILIVGFMGVTNNAPEALTHWKAARNGQNICRVHFRGKRVRDYIAEVDKAEKEIGTNYWAVPKIGLKFKPEPDDIEFIEGSIPCVNYYENIPEGMKIKQVVAFSQLKDFFRKKKMPIDGYVRDAMFVGQEYEKIKEGTDAIQTAIDNSQIKDNNTQVALANFLNTIEENRSELENMKLESGIFTWQTAMNALDATIAFTSAQFAHAKEVIRAAEARKEELKKRDYMMYAIIAFIFCIGAAAFIIATK